MQNKEVIGRIRAVKDTFGSWFSEQDHEALDLGIKALEINEKRLELIEKYTKKIPQNTYDSDDIDLVQVYQGMIRTLKECEVD